MKEQSSLTNNHNSEEISVMNIPNNRFVPCFHTNHRCYYVHERDSLVQRQKRDINANSNTSCNIIFHIYSLVINYHLTDVVAPGQEQYPSVVLLPVRQYEGKQDDP